MNIIETINLTKFYGKSRGIDNVSFQVAEGEIFGFIGPNGAGQIYRSGAINQTYILISVAIILIFVVAAYWSYNKRDLYI